ncbi:MAG: hypothetical protein [Cressdnaviricota sp.]|nr:MAG: hypothetical protein [Cressdnaviricota sp.]
MPSKITKSYRKIFGHKSPYRRVYGSRTPGQAIGVTYRTGFGVAKDLASLRKDVKEMKKRQNVEKNYVDTDVASVDLGQCNHNADGIYARDVTPAISQGDGQGNRHGNSLKLTGLSFPMSFVGHPNTHSSRKIVVSLMRVRDNNNNTSADDLITQYWDVNPLNGLRDSNAPKNYRNSKHDGIQCIRQKTYMLKATGQSIGNDSEQSHFTAKFNVSLQDVLRYEENGHSSPDGLRYFLVFQLDAGNKHGSTDATIDIPVKTAASGVTARISQRAWYVDN